MRALVAILGVVAASPAAAQVPTIPSLPGFARSPREREEASLHKLKPAQLELMPYGFHSYEGEPRVVRLRVFAARDYREQKFNWKEKFRRVIDRVNRAAEKWPGVRFEIVETKSWERDTVAASPEELVAELERLDPGRDVDLVIGLVASLPIVPTQIHQIGVARELGRHVLLRSLHDAAERAFVQRQYPALDDASRDAVLLERLPHKEAVVFLHEWAHSLGALHAGHSDFIMNPEYDHEQRRFDAANGRLVELAIASRAAGDDDATFRRKMGDYLRATRSEDWNPKDRDAELNSLAGRPAAPASPSDALTEKEQAALEEVKKLCEAKECDKAWSLVAPLVDQHPRHALVQLVACYVAGEWGGAGRVRATEKTCGAAAELAPADARPLLLLGSFYQKERADAKMLPILTRARERLERASSTTPQDWGMLADAYAAARSPTRSLEAAAHAGEATRQKLIRETTKMRRIYGMPAGAVEPDREREFVLAFELAYTALEGAATHATAPETAAMLVANLERDFPSVPGTLALGCERDLMLGHMGSAERSCARALAADGDSLSANIFVAEIEVTHGQVPAGIAHLKRAVELVPQLEGPWRRLADLYRKTNDRAALTALRADYQKQFGIPLP